MIVYLDASALVKLYVDEPGSREMAELVGAASSLGTAIVTLAEVSAAIARSARRGIIRMDEAEACRQALREQWRNLHRIEVTESVLRRATDLAWAFGLRGYDAIHLACAAVWQEMLGEAITVATYDRELWEAARRSGLDAWPALAG